LHIYIAEGVFEDRKIHTERGVLMVLVHVTLSPKGIHRAEIFMSMEEEDEAREFYTQLRPHLTHLDRLIGELKLYQQRDDVKYVI
jgi:hypothetical protein